MSDAKFKVKPIDFYRFYDFLLSLTQEVIGVFDNKNPFVVVGEGESKTIMLPNFLGYLGALTAKIDAKGNATFQPLTKKAAKLFLGDNYEEFLKYCILLDQYIKSVNTQDKNNNKEKPTAPKGLIAALVDASRGAEEALEQDISKLNQGPYNLEVLITKETINLMKNRKILDSSGIIMMINGRATPAPVDFNKLSRQFKIIAPRAVELKQANSENKQLLSKLDKILEKSESKTPIDKEEIDLVFSNFSHYDLMRLAKGRGVLLSSSLNKSLKLRGKTLNNIKARKKEVDNSVSAKKAPGKEGKEGKKGGSLKNIVVDFYIPLEPFKECKFKGKNSSLHAAATGVFQGIGARSGISIANRLTSQKTAGLSKKIISVLNSAVGNSKKFGFVTQALRLVTGASGALALSSTTGDKQDLSQNLGVVAGAFHPVVSVLALSGVKAWREETGLVAAASGTAKNIFSIPVCYLDTALYSAGLVSIFGVGTGASERLVRGTPGFAKLAAQNSTKIGEKFNSMSQWFEGLGEKVAAGERYWKIPIEVFNRKRKVHNVIQEAMQTEIFSRLSISAEMFRNAAGPISSRENAILQQALRDLLNPPMGESPKLFFIILDNDTIALAARGTEVQHVYIRDKYLEILRGLSDSEKTEIVEELTEFLSRKDLSSQQRELIQQRITFLSGGVGSESSVLEYYNTASKLFIEKVGGLGKNSTVSRVIKEALDMSEEMTTLLDQIKMAENIPRLIDSIALEGTSIGRGGFRRQAIEKASGVRIPFTTKFPFAGLKSWKLIKSPSFSSAIQKIATSPAADTIIEILETRAKNLQDFVSALDDVDLPGRIKLNVINKVANSEELINPNLTLQVDLVDLQKRIKLSVLEDLDRKDLEKLDLFDLDKAAATLEKIIEGEKTYFDARGKQISKDRFTRQNKRNKELEAAGKKVRNPVTVNQRAGFLDPSNPKKIKYEQIYDFITNEEEVRELSVLLQNRISHIKDSDAMFEKSAALLERDIESGAVAIRTILDSMAGEKVSLKTEYSPYSLYDALFQAVVDSTEDTIKRKILTSGALKPSILSATKSDLAQAYRLASASKDVAAEATKQSGKLFFKALFSRFVKAGFSESLKTAIPAGLMAAATANSESPFVPDQKTWDKIVDYVGRDEDGNLNALAKYIRDPLKSLNNGAVRDLAEEWGLDLDIFGSDFLPMRQAWNNLSDAERSKLYNNIIRNFIECTQYTSLILNVDSEQSRKNNIKIHKHVFHGPPGDLPDLTPYFSAALAEIKKSKNDQFKKILDKNLELPESWKGLKLPDFWQLSIVTTFTKFMFSETNEGQNWQAKSFNDQSKWIEFVKKRNPKQGGEARGTQREISLSPKSQMFRNKQISDFIKLRKSEIIKLLSHRLQKGSINEMTKNDIAKLIKEAFTDKVYGMYPYSHDDGDSEQPKEDYVEEWKSFCLEVVRDRDRTMAIRLAKILVKDLELFEDVLDLAGQNQSIGSEILRKMQKEKIM